MDAQKRKGAAASLLKDLEAAAARMRALIVATPARDLLGRSRAAVARHAPALTG